MKKIIAHSDHLPAEWNSWVDTFIDPSIWLERNMSGLQFTIAENIPNRITDQDITRISSRVKLYTNCYFDKITSKRIITRPGMFLKTYHYDELYIPIHSLHLHYFKNQLSDEFGLPKEKTKFKYYLGRVPKQYGKMYELDLCRESKYGIPFTLKHLSLVDQTTMETNSIPIIHGIHIQ